MPSVPHRLVADIDPALEQEASTPPWTHYFASGAFLLTVPKRSCQANANLSPNPPIRRVETCMTPISYKRHRFPPDTIRLAVWLYYRFTTSLRDVEDLLAECGINVSD